MINMSERIEVSITSAFTIEEGADYESVVKQLLKAQDDALLIRLANAT